MFNNEKKIEYHFIWNSYVVLDVESVERFRIVIEGAIREMITFVKHFENKYRAKTTLQI